jgi:uncharacterized Zn-finger protein
MNQHLGVKSYKCAYPNCNKSYSSFSRLKIHYRTHVSLFYINVYRQERNHLNVRIPDVQKILMKKET